MKITIRSIISLCAILIFTEIIAAHSFSSQGIELIHQKYKSGEISFRDYLMNKIFFVFDKDKLDSQFKFANDYPAKCATEMIIEFNQNKEKLSLSDIALIEKYLFPKEPLTPLAIYDSPGGKFRLTYETTGTNGVPAADGNSNGIPDYVEWIASYFDYSWAHQIDTMGYLAPPIGTGKYAISFESMGAYGYTEVVSGQLTRIVMHNNFLGFPPNTDPEGQQKGAAKVTAAHEFKHAHQIMYANWSDPPWFIELDATWMEDIAYDATNDYYNYITSSGSPFTSPGASLDAGQGYEDCNWMLYLCEKNNNLLNRRIWLRRQTNPGENMFTTFNTVLSSFYSTTFNDAFREYIVWNFLTNSRATTTHPVYGEATAYPLASLCRTVTTYPHNSTNCTITKYSANFIRLNPVANSNSLYISFNGANSPHVFKVSVVTRTNAGQVQSAEISLNADNDGNYLIPIANNNLDYAGLCIAVVSSSTGPTFSYSVAEQTGSSASINILSGWNLMSVPVAAANMEFTSLFSEATSNAYYYDVGYTIGTTAVLGKGFWLKFPSAQTKSIFGTPQSSVTVNVTSGWNIVGPLHVDIPAANVTTNPSGIITSPFYGYNSGYQTATTLEKGKSYWVKVSATGTMTMPTTLSKEIQSTNQELPSLNELTKLIFTNAAGEVRVLYISHDKMRTSLELPPIPPAGVFDVRFDNNSFISDLSSIKGIINLNSMNYPITLKIENSNSEFVITDLVDGKIVNSKLTAGEQITISNSAINKLRITQNFIPSEFALFQNYPNPFNPSTVISYQLSAVSHVTLKVYDMLGREIAVLVNEIQEPGKYNSQFSIIPSDRQVLNSPLTSGIYIYQLKAGEFSASKKLVLMK